MKISYILGLSITMLIFTSCDVLLKTATTVINSNQSLTSADVAAGLKEALKVGVDSAVVRLNKTNGYYLNPLLKINLPSEADQVLSYAQKVPGLDKLIEDLVLQVNRSAEDAALQAAPVFKKAILTMSIDDAWKILNGNDDAATQYLLDKTYADLTALYLPIMQKSLNKPLVANVSAADTWGNVTSKWNKFANSIPGKIMEAQAVNNELDVYVTDKALKGVFLKVGEQEKEIRNNADARVNEILKRVFASKQ